MLEISGIKASPSWAKPEEQMPTQEAVCPWESVDPVSFTPQPGLQDTGGPKASFQMSGSVESKTAEICPWDAEETLPAEKAGVMSKVPALPKEKTLHASADGHSLKIVPDPRHVGSLGHLNWKTIYF